MDVTKKELVEQRILLMKSKKIRRIVAAAGNDIVADGALELNAPGEKANIAELRLIVAHPFQRKGLGMHMAFELYLLAQKEDVKEIVVKMMKPQKGAQSIFHKLGFHDDVTLESCATDQHGHKQDLIIMRCSLSELWRDMEDYFFEKDMRRAVTHMF